MAHRASAPSEPLVRAPLPRGLTWWGLVRSSSSSVRDVGSVEAGNFGWRELAGRGLDPVVGGVRRVVVGGVDGADALEQSLVLDGPSRPRPGGAFAGGRARPSRPQRSFAARM